MHNHCLMLQRAKNPWLTLMSLLMVSVYVSSVEIPLAKWKQERQMHHSVKETPEFHGK